jgi:serine/threonine protein phosphatase PrpC
MKYDLGKANRLGTRSSNQDRFTVVERPHGVLLALADGMGGYEGGLLAASTFVVKLTELFRAAPSPLPDPAEFLRRAFVEAHHAVVDAGARQQPPLNPRTTGVACVLQDGTAWWAHVGDSRCYLLRGGGVVARTRDHSPVEDLLQQGKITEKQMNKHPQRNQVTRCLGGNAARTPEPEVAAPCALAAGDVVMLCSDGLWASMDDEHIAVHLAESVALSRLVDDLAGQAEANSYPKCDNVSLVALRFIENGTRAAQRVPEHGVTTQDDSAVDAVIDEINAALQRAEEGIKNLT